MALLKWLLVQGAGMFYLFSVHSDIPKCSIVHTLTTDFMVDHWPASFLHTFLVIVLGGMSATDKVLALWTQGHLRKLGEHTILLELKAFIGESRQRICHVCDQVKICVSIE